VCVCVCVSVRGYVCVQVRTGAICADLRHKCTSRSQLPCPFPCPPQATKSFKQPIMDIAWAPDGMSMVVCSGDGSITAFQYDEKDLGACLCAVCVCARVCVRACVRACVRVRACLY